MWVVEPFAFISAVTGGAMGMNLAGVMGEIVGNLCLFEASVAWGCDSGVVCYV